MCTNCKYPDGSIRSQFDDEPQQEGPQIRLNRPRVGSRIANPRTALTASEVAAAGDRRGSVAGDECKALYEATEMLREATARLESKLDPVLMEDGEVAGRSDDAPERDLPAFVNAIRQNRVIVHEQIARINRIIDRLTV